MKTNIERKVCGWAGILILFVWCAVCVTDVNHPPGVRWVRIGTAVLVILLGMLAYRHPSHAICAFAIVWPQQMVAREFLLVRVHYLFDAIPSYAGCAMTSALLIGCAFRNRNVLESSQTPSMNPIIRIYKMVLCLFAASWVISTLVFYIRLKILGPLENIFGPTDYRHLLETPYDSLIRPAWATFTYLPSLLLGIVLLEDVGVDANKESDSNAAISHSQILTALSISGAIIALQVLGDIFFKTIWFFDKWAPGGPFPNRTIAAPVLAISGAVSILQTIRIKSQIWKWILWILGLGIIFTGCAVSKNGLFTSIVFFCLLLFSNRETVQKHVAAIISIIIVLCIAAFISYKYAGNTAPTIAQFGTLRESIRQRSRIFETAWNLWKYYPIFGSGAGTFEMLTERSSRFVCALGDGSTPCHAHNMALNTFAELGVIPGLCWIAAWLAIPAIAIWRGIKINSFAIVVLLTGIVNLSDCVWLERGFTTVAVLLIVLFCAELSHDADLEQRGRPA